MMMDVSVSVEWLAAHLNDDDLVVVDGSWHLPTAKRDPKAEYLSGHIPGAVFFDLDTISDQESNIPHMMPKPEAFARDAGSLGIRDEDTIVVYDSVGLFSAARIWWMFREYGATKVYVLDGGLPAWKAAGHQIETGKPDLKSKTFNAVMPLRDVAIAEVLEAWDANTHLILDARGAGRFLGTEQEPRADMRSGHMPNAISLPFTELIDREKKLLPTEALREKFKKLDVDFSKPIIASCGSGVTACVILLALTRVGNDSAKLYDGSWAEWGARADTPVLTG